ncbi:MAG: hypothetical protein U1E46_11675 [Hyphomicrobiales bacterium]
MAHIMKSPLLLAGMALWLGSAAVPALADDADGQQDWNSVVAAYYIADAVYDHCGFRLTSAEMSELNQSLDKAERESGLSTEELQALRDDIQQNADDNTTEFCATNGRYVRSTAQRQ